ncbi:MAG: hypothetical protein ACI4I3_05550 [Acutalibacteraceae bacterium]
MDLYKICRANFIFANAKTSCAAGTLHFIIFLAPSSAFRGI